MDFHYYSMGYEFPCIRMSNRCGYFYDANSFRLVKCKIQSLKCWFFPSKAYFRELLPNIFSI